jgi:hypothetical protein
MYKTHLIVKAKLYGRRRGAYGKTNGKKLKFNSSQGKSFPATCYFFFFPLLPGKELGYFGIHLKTSELNDF